MRTLFVAALLALAGSVEAWGGYHKAESYRYSLPGDLRWPSQRQFGWMKNYINGEVYLKGEDGYAPYTFSTRTNTPQPAVIVHPSCIRDIQKAVGFARWHGMRISVMSTGHHYDVRNIADNAVHIMMTNFDDKEILDVGDEKHIRVGPGQTFGEISEFVREQTSGEWAVATGADSTVGPYGWTTGGGHGYLSRLTGYGADHLVSMRVMLTSGFVVTASETRHKKLFRALRGGGGSAFGICVSMTMRLQQTPAQVTTHFGVYFPQDPGYEALIMQTYQNYMDGAPKEVGGYYLTLGAIPGSPVFIIAFCYGGDCEQHVAKIAGIPGCVPGILPNSCVQNNTDTYYSLVNALAPTSGGNQYAVSAAIPASQTFNLLQTTTAWVKKEETLPVSKFCTQSSVLGGEARNKDPEGKLTSIAPGMRNADIQVTCIAAWEESATVEQRQTFVDEMTSWSETSLKPFGNGWVYWNEPQHNFPNGDWKERYWGGSENYNELLRVKKRYDFTNALTCFHCIGWEFDAEVDPAVCPGDVCTCSNNADGACN